MVETLLKVLHSDYGVESISDLVSLKNDIQKMKDKNCDLLYEFYEEEGNEYRCKFKDGSFDTSFYSRFCPRKEDDITGVRRNVGLYSTAICIQTIIAYEKEYKKSKNKSDREKKYFTENKCKDYFKFIVRGLTERLLSVDPSELGQPAVIQPALLSIVNTLNWFSEFFLKYNNQILSNGSEDILIEQNYLKCLLIELVIKYYKEVYTEIENSHPYISFKFLHFLRNWNTEIRKAVEEIYDPSSTFVQQFNEISDGILFSPQNLKKIQSSLKLIFITPEDKEKNAKELEKETTEYSKEELEIKTVKSKFKDCEKQCFDRIYINMKYELYRQMGLKLSGDMALFDVKRLIYALLSVHVRDKFSNSLVRDKALTIIFETPSKNPNAIWTAGQQVHLSRDHSESITTLECIYDLLEGDSERDFLSAVTKFLPDIKKMFFSILRTAQKDENMKIKGWYPLNQRDKTSTSWTSAFTLLFIKRFCRRLSFEIEKKAEDFFYQKYRWETKVGWNDIYDHTTVKSKLRLMFPSQNGEGPKSKITMAMFFGPPGTGKTTLARAFAAKLKCRYLELTPGDFYSAGENEILPKINEIFYNLEHLKDTVVFIDEIDDLVVDRDSSQYDPRSLYVNTLLPRFQDIHDNRNIILIASTNNIDKVDKAIYRLGRFDLILPIFSLSVHGRIDFLANKFLNNDTIVGATETNENILYSNIFTYVQETKYYTYSQLEIFITELKKQANSDDFVKKDSKIEEKVKDISKRLGFENQYLYLNPTSKEAIIYRIKEDRKAKRDKFIYKTTPRPFSVNDADDENAENKKMILGSVIPLYFSIYKLINFEIDNDNDILEMQKVIITAISNLMYPKSGDPLYCLVTPFLDSLELFFEKDKNLSVCNLNLSNSKFNSIKDAYVGLKTLIDQRSIIN